MAILLVLPFFVFGQTVVIPRAGFPYCQPFTGNGDPNSLPFTVARGDEIDFSTSPIGEISRPLSLTGQSLRLTTSERDLRGYVFVDLPFSSVYGIKTSFEYFVHTPGPGSSGLGDGLSFFLFDGSIGINDGIDPITPTEFEIGGVGGSLGYAPHGSLNGNYNMGGLKGGYMGIGFDILGNFGNYQEKKYGGFHDLNQFNFSTPIEDDRKFYPDAVTIRGPVNAADAARRNGSPPTDMNPLTAPYYDSYQFVSGKITSYMVGFPYPLVGRVARGSGDLFLDPSKSSFFLPSGEMFRLGSGLIPAANICNDPGYRKVFIDLRPTNNPAIPYTITLDMLVGNELINILNNVPYRYQAPEVLKVGFSASTGGSVFSAFDIRNVTVEVSSISEELAPKPPALSRELCINDETEFEFEVDLPSENSFITCIQLSDVNLGPADNSGSDSNQFDCGLSGACDEKCLDTRKTLTIPGKGTLITELEELTQGTGGNFDSERKIAKIKFVPASGFIGTFEAYYQITDNYGLQSDWTLVKITVNPVPELVDEGEIFDPTCAGQNDGAIRNVIVRDLAPGYTFTWRDQSNNLVPVANQTFTSVPSGNYEEVTFGLENINLGTYTLEITNPSIEAPCNLSISRTLEDESGTPVIILDPITEICEQTPITYTPQVSAVYTNNVSVPPIFLWYTDPNRLYPIANNSNELIVNGNPIPTGLITIGGSGDGRLTIESLPEGIYTFYVEVDDTDFPTGGNFCLQRGALEKVDLTVFPAIQASVVEAPDWCLESKGSLVVTSIGGQGGPTFTLFDDSGNQVRQNQTGNFPDLSPGDYSIEIETLNPNCFLSIPGKVEGPEIPLTLTPGPTVNAYCNEPNGSLEFTLLGGNPAYSVTLDGNPLPASTAITGNVYKVSDLAAGTYALAVTDSKGCVESTSITITGDPVPQFDATDDEICEGETAILSPQIQNQSSSIPTFEWYYLDASSNYIQINSGTTVGGVTFTLDGSSNLSVAGLAPQATPYTYYLEVKGSKVCDPGYIPAEVLVNPKPLPIAPIVAQVTCQGKADGEINAQLSSGNLADFEFSLIGDNGFNSGFVKNSGQFPDLAPGTYELFVKSAKGCEASYPGIVITEPNQLAVTEVSKVDASCAVDNGNLRFTVAGGTQNADSGYSIKVNGAELESFGADLSSSGPNDFTISNLAPGDYLIEAIDQNGCLAFLTITLADLPVPEFAVSDVTFCEGTPAVLSPILGSNTIGVIPEFTWSYEDPTTAGQLIKINDGDVLGDVTYDVTNGVLTATGLVFQADPYNYYLTVSGDKVCPADPLEVKVTILKIPEAVFEEVPVSCFGGNDGQIKLISVDPSGGNTFTLIETNESNNTGDFIGLAAGDYTIRVQENGSPCFNEFPILVTQPDQIELIDLGKTDPTCGAINGSVKFEILGGIKDYLVLVNNKPLEEYTFSLTSGVYELKNLPPGEYSITIQDANNCTLPLPGLFNLVNDEGFTVDLNPMKEEACLGQNILLSPTFASAIPVTPVLKWYKDAGLTDPIVSNSTPDAEGVTYQINSSDGNLSIEGLGIGAFEYFLEVSGPGICTVVKSAEVEIFPELTVAITIENIRCFEDKSGEINLVPSGGNGVFEVSINNSPFSPNLSYTNLSSGQYIVVVRNDIGCEFTDIVTVESPSSPITINSPTIERSSCGLDNGSIRDLVISGGWGNYSVEWRRGSITGPVITGTAMEALNLAPDTYYLLVTDAEGCTEPFYFEIEESSDPVYAVVPPINSCTGSPVFIRPIHIAPDPSLPPAAATEVRWYTGPNQTGLIVNGTDPSLPTVSYTIDDSDWLNPELEIAGLPAGTYDYYFYVVCTGQEIKVDVSVFDTPEVVIETNPVTCFGDTNGKVNIFSGALATYTYSVNGDAPLDQAVFESLNFGAGTYTLTVGTPAGCAQTTSFTIDGPSAPLVSSPLTKIDPGCATSNGKLILTVTGGWVPYTFDVLRNGTVEQTLTTSDSDITLDGFTVGDYRIEIRDAEGCMLTTNEVTLVDGPTQILVDRIEICEGTSATLTPVLDPAASNTTFEWYFDQDLTRPISSSPDPASDGRIYEVNPSTGVLTITGLPQRANSYNYFVTVTGPTVCSGFIGQGVVNVFGTPSATASVTGEVCFGDGGTITINATGGAGNYTYSLDNTGFVTTNVFNVPTGSHSIEVRTPQGCSFRIDDIQVDGPSGALNVTSLDQDDASCGLENGEIRFNVEGGYSPYDITYTKNGVASGSVASANGNIRLTNLGLGTYNFTIIDAQGCELTFNNPVTINEVPTTITANDDVICEGESAELIPSVPLNIPDPQFTWSFDALGNSPISSGVVGGATYSIGQDGRLEIAGLDGSGSPYTYYVFATGTGICGLTPKPVSVTVNPILNLKVSNPSIVCDPNGQVDLSDYIEGFNPSVYDYNVLSPTGSSMQLDEIESVQISGDYRVSSALKGTNCWNQPQRIRVLIAEEELIANFQYEIDLGDGTLITNGDIQIQEDVQFQDLTLGKAIIWNWDFGDGLISTEQNPVHQFEKKGSYLVKLTAIDSIGCISIYELMVNVFDDYNVMIPNAFTPDGVKNTTFRPYYRGIASSDFYIFNTWGELIYYSNSLGDQGWDGTLNGKNVPNGNYVYRGKFVSRSGITFEKSGVFVLIR